jgi:tRNA-splicing ligase RtcB
MSISVLKGKNVPIHLWARAEEAESRALDQLKNVAALPWVFHHVAVIPDVHYGKGCTVGSVVAMDGAVAPAAVGVDIGCGMAAVKTSLDANKVDRKLKQVFSRIEELIPVGFNQNLEPVLDKVKSDFRLVTDIKKLMEKFPGLTKKVQGKARVAMQQLGTLGGGQPLHRAVSGHPG